MELVEGRTLGESIPKGGLPVDRILKVAIPLVNAVTAAHERGITHRDLKPANVMIGTDGRVKVLDFGLAKLEETIESSDDARTTLKADSLTGEGRIVGTVAYMSPEQAEGKPLDQRSDIFSLGVVLYEMATGEKPFKGETTVSTLSSILRDVPPSVTDVNSALPRDLARIIKRALVKDPEHRYQTAKDFRNDLESLKEEIDSGSIEASRVSGVRPAVVVTTPEPAAKQMSKAMLGASAAAVAAAITAALWFGLKGGSSPPVAATRPFDQIKLSRLTNSGKVGLAALSADARYVVHVVLDAGKQSLWLRQVATNSNVQIVPPDAVRYDGLSFSPDNNFIYYVVYPQQSSFSTAYQVPVLGGAARKIVEDVDSALVFSPDGTRMAFLRGYNQIGESAIVVASAAGTDERKLAIRKMPLPFILNNLSWSPDGKTLLAIARVGGEGKNDILAIDTETGAQSTVGSRPWAQVASVAWMPDGRGFIASAVEDAPGASLQIWHISYPKGEARRLTSDLNNYSEASVSADGKTLIAVQGQGVAHLWVAPTNDPNAARQITTGTGTTDGVNGLGWTHDGRIVYNSASSNGNDLWSVDAAGGEPRQLTVDPGVEAGFVVTPDGKEILFLLLRPGGPGGAWRMNADGSNLRNVVSPPGASRPAVSPDMQWLYFTSFATQQRQTFRMALAGGTPEVLTAHWDALGIKEDGIFYHPTLQLMSLSRDGKQVLGYYNDVDRRGWRMGIFPLAGGVPTRLDILDVQTTWLPDGQLLYRDSSKGIANLYRMRIGGAPVQLTKFTDDGIASFALSRDGKQIAMSRGKSTSDVVVIRTGEK